MANSSRHILYTVLNWGLGHATRSIPIISRLLIGGHRVTLAGEGASGWLLRERFPELDYVEVKGIDIRYSTGIPAAFSVVLQAGHMHTAIKREKQAFQKIAQHIGANAIISDNRYGAYCDGIPSVMICHQLSPAPPAGLQFLQPIVDAIHARYLKPFTQLWIPDVEESPGMSGKLSHRSSYFRSLQPRFIGPISRLADVTEKTCERNYDILAILSGPEPARSQLEALLTRHILAYPGELTTLMVCGTPDAAVKMDCSQRLHKVAHLTPEELKFHLVNSRYIICRSGYSSLMDLAAVHRSALCIPTPGQTEQEYLAQLHSSDHRLVSQEQRNLDLSTGLKKLSHCQSIYPPVNEGIRQALDDFLSSL